MSTNSEESERDLRRLVGKVAAKEKRIFGFSMVLTVLALIGGSAWMWYAYHHVQDLNTKYGETLNKAKDLASDVDRLQSEGDRLQKEIQLKRKSLDIIYDSDLGQLVPRIYIQIGNENQRDRASKVQQAVQTYGYLVPGIEKTDSSNKEPTTLSYYRENQKREAENAVEILQNLGVKIGSPVYVEGKENSKEMRARHYDLWLGPDF